MTVRAGYGTETIHLGQKAPDLRAALGQPSRRRSAGSMREHWLYTPLAFEAVVSRKTGNLLSLFYQNGSPLLENHFFTLDEPALRKVFGEPALVIEGTLLSDGSYLDRLLSYNSGISFFLGGNGIVRKVSITHPKRTPRRKAAQSAPARHQSIAALRRRGSEDLIG